MGEFRFIDLNADVGESFGAYTHGRDAEVMRHISSANIACGCHAGDPVVMRRTVELARRYNVSVGAHPGLPDLQGFGRREMALSPDDAKQYVIYQASALAGFTTVLNLPLQHIKLHGALYNMAMRDEKLARAITEGIRDSHPQAIVLALPDSIMLREAQRAGLKTAREAFADRAYLDDGSLAPRNHPGAVIHDPEIAAAQAVAIATRGRIKSLSGTALEVPADSICVHGDNPEAISLLARIREALANAKVVVRPLHEFI